MARGVNRCFIIGNLGADPEIRYTQAGAAVANINVATTESWKDKQTGEKQEKTEWHRVVMFGRLGEIAGEYLKKGSKVYIEGRLQTDKYQAQDGTDRYTTKIVANDMQMLDSGQGQQQGHGGGQGAPQGSGQPQGQAPQDAPGQFDDMDDDIPF